MDLVIRDDDGTRRRRADNIAAARGARGERAQERCDPRLSRDARRARLLPCARGVRASGVEATVEYAVVVLVVALMLVAAGGVAAAQGDGVADSFRGRSRGPCAW